MPGANLVIIPAEGFMASISETLEITIPCPKCEKKLKGRLGRLRREKSITCPTCGKIEIGGEGLAKIQRSLKEAERKLAGLGGKAVKFKL
jgi:hypothetical protein